MKKRILCLWLPRWPIQRRIVAQPRLSGQPIVLHARDVRRGECVAVCSTAALRRGVKIGMPLAEAISLLEADTSSPAEQSLGRKRGPMEESGLPRGASENSRQRLLSEAKAQHALVGHAGKRRASFSAQNSEAPLNASHAESARSRKAAQPGEAAASCSSGVSCYFAPHQPEADRKALLELAAWCEQFSPHVGLEPHSEPQSLLLDITGLGPLFGGEEALAWRVIEAFGRRGYSIRVAVADTVGAAWALSHFGADLRSGKAADALRPPPTGSPGKSDISRGQARSSSVVARNMLPASAVSAPRIIPPGQHREAIGSLAVEALRLPAPTLETLHQLGVFQIGQVAELPRASLASRFQHEGKCVLIERLDQAFGVIEELIAPHRPPPEFRGEFCLEYPVASLAGVQTILAELFDKLCRELASVGKGVLHSVCRLDCEGGEVRKIELGLFQPTASAERLLELAAMQLEQLRLPGGVGRVGVEVEIAAPLTVRQQTLFAREDHSRPRELAFLIDRLSSRLGADHVFRPRLLSDAQPERAFCETSLIGHWEEKRKAESGRRKKSNGTPHPAAFRVRFSASERPLRLWSPPIAIQVVALADGPPASFRIGRRCFRVHRWWGPERIETAWWRGRSVRRDYYQVETTTGARYWLYRHLRIRKWFLHGEYG